MEESIYKYMKVGLIHFMAYPETLKGEGPILETLQKIAADPYFNLVEISWIKDPSVRRKAKELLETSGLEVRYGAQPKLLIEGLDLNSMDEEKRLKAVRAVDESIDEALEMGAKSLAILSGKYPGEDMKDKAIENLVKSIKEICLYANEREPGFPIALEIFDRNVDKKCLIGPTKDARRVAEGVKKECINFGLMHDLSHLPLLNERPGEALVPIKDYLIHVHLGNCVLKQGHPAYGDQHPRFGIEHGENDVEQVVEFLKTLIDICYLDGLKPKPVSFEVKPLPGEDPELVIASAKRTLNEAWGMLEI